MASKKNRIYKSFGLPVFALMAALPLSVQAAPDAGPSVTLGGGVASV